MWERCPNVVCAHLRSRTAAFCGCGLDVVMITSPTEVWEFQKIRTSFIFEDESEGKVGGRRAEDGVQPRSTLSGAARAIVD